MSVVHFIDAFLGKILLLPIGGYQRFISPFTPAVCKYYPSCSAYTVTAISHHGALKGIALGSWRLLRCNPWSRGGYDPVPGTPNILQDQRDASPAPDSTTHEG